MSDAAAAQLAHAGMSGEGATRKAALFELAAGSLAGHRHPELYRCYVPGRIEVLGKHTDYAGGRSLLCAAERGLCVVALPRDDGVVSVTDALNRQTAIFEFSADLAIQPGDWSVYPGTVVRRIARNFGPPLAGAEVAFASDLPRAAGMSSSSALVVAVFQALSAVNRLEERDEYRANIGSKEDLAAYLGCVENGQSYGSLIGDRGVGTFGGSEDHTAILCSRPGHLAQYSFCPVRFERSVKLPTDCTFVIGVSGVVADKIGSARDKYNLASRAAQAVLQSWRAASGSTAATLAEAVANSSEVEEIWKALRQASSDGFDSAALLNRFEQFLLESMTIVPQVGAALESADLRAFGALVDRSQTAAEELLGNQVPETIELVRNARSLGAYAASAFGAGFGGSVWALVAHAGAARFTDKWSTSYRRQFPGRAVRSQFFQTAPGIACTALSSSGL